MPTHEEIQTLAFRLWERKSQPYGTAQTDWFDAEARLRNQKAAQEFAPTLRAIDPPPAEETTHLIFACDESAAKGKSDQDEQRPGQVGVFVGILMPDEMSAVRGEFDALSTK